MMGLPSGQFSSQIGPDHGGASELATAIARAGGSTAQQWWTQAGAATEVLKRRLAVTSTPGDLILFKAKCHPVKKKTDFPASWAVVAHSVCSAWS